MLSRPPAPRNLTHDTGIRSRHARLARRMGARPAGACRGVTSNVRYFPPHPIYMDHARGAHMVDVDGREYLDYCLAFAARRRTRPSARVAAVQGELARAAPRSSHPDDARTGSGGAPRPPAALRRDGPLHQLGHRIDDARDPARARGNGTDAHREVRGALPRRARRVLFNLDRHCRPRRPTTASAGHAGTTIVLPFNDIPALEAAFDDASDIAASSWSRSRGRHPARPCIPGARALAHRAPRRRPHLRRGRGVARVGLAGAQASSA